MENFEIFSNHEYLRITIFALLFLFISAYHAAKEKVLTIAVLFFSIATGLNFIETFVEAKAVENFNLGYPVETYVMTELLLLFVAMMMIIVAALTFLSIQVRSKLFIASGLILSALGCGAIVLFTVIKPAGDIVNNMLTVFPLVGYVLLAVGLTGKFAQRYARGYILAFVVAIISIIMMVNYTFFSSENISWYAAPLSYVLYGMSFLLMKSDELLIDRHEKKLKFVEQNKKIKEIIRLSPFPIIISHLGDDRIILANENAIKLFGLEERTLDKHHLKEFFADADNRRQLLEKIKTQDKVQDFEVLVNSPNSTTPFWLMVSANVITYDNGLALYTAFQDITSRKKRENILENQATRDPLTSVYNRRYFEDEVKQRIVKLESESKEYSVLMLDADFFKRVNDTYGHKIGDKVLIELSGKTEKALRDNDIVARYGGEEFVVFLPGINADQAAKVADRLRQAIASIVVMSDNNEEVRFTVSIGVSSSAVAKTVDDLIRKADAALYRAKQNGRNRVEVFTSEDVKDFEEQGEFVSKNEKSNVHPVFEKQESEEISLIDEPLDNKDIPDIEPERGE